MLLSKTERLFTKSAIDSCRIGFAANSNKEQAPIEVRTKLFFELMAVLMTVKVILAKIKLSEFYKIYTIQYVDFLAEMGTCTDSTGLLSGHWRICRSLTPYECRNRPCP